MTSASNLKVFKTLEFLLVVVTNLAAWAAAIGDQIPNRWAVYATVLSGALFALARGLGKQNADTKDYWQTSEFWLALVTAIPGVVAVLADVIQPTTYAVLQGGSAAMVAIAMGLRKDPHVAAGNVSASDVRGETDLFVTDDMYDPALDGDDIAAHGADEAQEADSAPAVGISPADMGGMVGSLDDPPKPMQPIAPPVPTQLPAEPLPPVEPEDAGGGDPPDSELPDEPDEPEPPPPAARRR